MSYFGTILGPFPLNLGKTEFSWKTELCQILNAPIINHHAKNQKKLKKNNARTFSKDSTTQENIRIYRLKKRLRNLYNKVIDFKPDLSNTLDKPLAVISLAFLKAFNWVD